MEGIKENILQQYAVGKNLSIKTVSRRLDITRRKLRFHVNELVDQEILRKTSPTEVGSGKANFTVYTRV